MTLVYANDHRDLHGAEGFGLVRDVNYELPSCCLANECYQASSSEIALTSILNSSLPRLHRHPRCQG